MRGRGVFGGELKDGGQVGRRRIKRDEPHAEDLVDGHIEEKGLFIKC